MAKEVNQEQFVSLKPNKKKIFLSNFMKVIFVAVSIVVIFLALGKFIGFDVLLMPLKVFNVNVESKMIIINFISAVFGVALLSSLLSLFSISGINYNIYRNRINVCKTILLFLISSKDISYDHIFRVNFTTNSLFNKIFSTGTVTLELTGLKEKSINLEFIDNPSNVVNYLQNILIDYRQTRQAIFDEQHKIGSILDQF